MSRQVSDHECLLAVLTILGLRQGDVVSKEDWSNADIRYFVELVGWHRVASQIMCVADRTSSTKNPSIKGVVPDLAWFQIVEQAKAQTVSSMSQLPVLRALMSLFDEAQIRILFLKGIVLSTLLYGQPFNRHTKDIDIWIRESDLPDAVDLLVGAGFTLISPSQLPEGRALERFVRVRKDMVFVSKGAVPVEIELHWRLDKNKYLFPLTFDQAYLSRQSVCVLGQQCWTLSLEHSFLYLVSHGSASFYGRVKWLLDVVDMRLVLKQQEGSDDRILEIANNLKQINSVAFTARLIEEVRGDGSVDASFQDRIFDVASVDGGFRLSGVLSGAVISNARKLGYMPLWKRWVMRLFLVPTLRYKIEQLRIAYRLVKDKAR